MNSAFGNIRTIAWRELYSYFASPIAYVFIVIFLLLAGFFTFMEGLGNFFQANEASLQSFFLWHPWLYMFLVPAAGMRLWSEEKRGGTLELLFTMPTTAGQGIIAKYLAGLVFLALALLLTFPMLITVNQLGEPDNGALLCGYLGSFCVAASFLAISSLLSALTKNQVVAFIISLVICLLLILAGFRPVVSIFDLWAPAWTVDTVAAFSVLTHYESLQRGVIDSRDILYFVSVAGFALFGTAVVLNNRRA